MQRGMGDMRSLFQSFGVTFVLILAIFFGGLVGVTNVHSSNALVEWVDPLVLLLVSLVIFNVPFGRVAEAFGNWRFISLAWVVNFLVIPMAGFGIASLFLSGYPLFFTGVVIYFMSPCTDWFLGFTRLARGNTSLGTVLIPINMISQIVLYPVFLWLFVRASVPVDFATLGEILWKCFLVPAVGAMVLRVVLNRFVSTSMVSRVASWVDWALTAVIAVLVFVVFAANSLVIAENLGVFCWILLAVFVFFVLTYGIGEAVSRLARLPYSEHALLAMTTAARNAPLMLAITMVSIPGQPLVYAAIVMGMLVEFPHLTALRNILSWRAGSRSLKVMDPVASSRV